LLIGESLKESDRKIRQERLFKRYLSLFGNRAGVSTLLSPHGLLQVAKTSSGLSLSLSG